MAQQPDSSHRLLPHLWGGRDVLIGRKSTEWREVEMCPIHRGALFLTSTMMETA